MPTNPLGCYIAAGWGYHFRYRKMGTVAYRHVANNYIAVFQHFIPPGIWEAIYVIEGMLRLRGSFDTSQILRLVDQLDACLAELGGVVAVRDEMLKLHAIALTLVEGAPLTVPTENVCIWSEAESLQQDLESTAGWVRSAQAGIAPLVNLAPNHEIGSPLQRSSMT